MKPRKTNGLLLAAVLAALVALGMPVGQANAELIGRWDFESGYTDVSGNGLGGSPVGTATIVTDPARGQVLSLSNSADSYVNVADNALLNLSTEVTVAGWVYALNGGPDAAWSKGQWDQSYSVRLDDSTSDGPLHKINFHGRGNISSSGAVPVGQWAHIAVTFDVNDPSTDTRFYINGALDSAKESGSALSTNATPLRIGYANQGWSRWNGMIDDVQIYDAKLTDTEIQTVMNGGVVVPDRLPVGRLSAGPGGKIAGAAYIENTATGQPSGDPLTWKVEVLSMQQTAGLRTQWHDGVGDVGLGGLDAVFATAPSIPVFQSPQVAFGGPAGFPPEVPAPMGAGRRHRTVQFTGQIFIPESGVYQFKDGVDQTTRLIIDGQTIIADSQWSGFDGSGGDGGGSLIQTATFVVDPGGEWLDFEFAMSESCCGDHAALYWDYLDGDGNFPTARNEAANINDLVPPDYFRSVALSVIDTLTGTTEIGGAAFDEIFVDDLGNMIAIPAGVDTRVRLSIDGRLMADMVLTAPAGEIPEPMTMLAVALGITGLGGYIRKRRRA